MTELNTGSAGCVQRRRGLEEQNNFSKSILCWLHEVEDEVMRKDGKREDSRDTK